MPDEPEYDPTLPADRSTTPTPADGAPPESPLIAPPGGAPPEPPSPAPANTVAGRVWVALGVAVTLLILLIIFIAENSRAVEISFLGAHIHFPLALSLLAAAVVGAVIAILVGTTRILQLRREVRAHRRRAARLAATDQPKVGTGSGAGGPM